MIDDLLPFIHDTKLRGAIAGLIEGVLIAAIDLDVAQRDAGHFLELPAHPAPIHRSHDGCEVFAVGFLVKQLGEDLLRALQAFRFAALPMRDRIRAIQPLNAAPGKGADLYCFAGGWASQKNQPDAPGPLMGSWMMIRCQPLPVRTMK